MDRLSPKHRSWLMSRVKGCDTTPELTVRKAIHALGYRYRLHPKELPGKPDIVFSSRKKAIFVHGCFWHGHGCRIGRPPKTKRKFWNAKFATNRARDTRVLTRLNELGWDALVVWQCELKDLPATLTRIVDFLD